MSLPSRACQVRYALASMSHSISLGFRCSGRTLAKMEVQMGSTSTLAALIRVWSLSACERIC